MNEPFDPYHRWLGIRDAARPPNHYRLLGVELFEDNPSAIQSSADRQMGHLRTFQTGQHSTLSQRLLNEIAVAKLCLLNPKAKAAYDAQLRVSLGLSLAPAPMPVPVTRAVAPAALAPKPPSAFAAQAMASSASAGVPAAQPGEGPSFAGIGDPLAGGPEVRDEYRRLFGVRTLWPALMAAWCAMLVFLIVVRVWFWPDLPEQGEVQVERRIVVREKPKKEKPVKPVPVVEGPPALEELKPIGEHKTGVWAVAFSPDGQKLVSAGTDRIVRVWDAEQGVELLETLAEDLIHGVAFSPDGQFVAMAGVDGAASWWDVTGDEVPAAAFRQQGEALCVAISPDGTMLASGGKDGTLLVHRTPEFPRVHRLEAHSGGIHALAFSPDSRRLATAGVDGAVRIWNLETGEQERALEGTGAMTAVAWSRNGAKIVSGARDGAVRIWDAKTGRAGYELSGHSDMIRSVVIAPDSRRAVTAGADRTIRVWDLATGEELARGAKHSAAVFGLAISPKGRLASASADATLRTWRLPEVPQANKP